MSRLPFSDAPKGGENLGEESSEESSEEDCEKGSRETGKESCSETGKKGSKESCSEAGKKGSKEDCKEEEMLKQQGNGPSPVSSVHFFPAVVLWWNLAGVSQSSVIGIHLLSFVPPGAASGGHDALRAIRAPAERLP